jgi:KRAB domain-containing zinc finger protein
VCKGCNKHFANKSNLARHSKIHTGNMLECNVCTKAYPTYYDLKRHTESVHGCRRFVCEHDDCHKVFKSAVGLSNHNKEHQGQFSYLCQYCGKGFSYKTDYKEHKLKHEGKKTFTCSKCGKCFHIKENMKRRFLQCGNKQRSFSCDICGKKLRCERYLKEHLKGHSNPDQYQCATCGNCL